MVAAEAVARRVVMGRRSFIVAMDGMNSGYSSD